MMGQLHSLPHPLDSLSLTRTLTNLSYGPFLLLSTSSLHHSFSRNSRVLPEKGRVKLIFLALAKEEIPWCQGSTRQISPYLAK